jgi:regulatory associated protein of mTOR
VFWSELCSSLTVNIADGVVRLYRNYDPALEPGPVQMVSAFRGLNEIVPMQRGAGLVMDWKQSSGILLVGGDSRVIKAWDAQTEIQHLVSRNFSDWDVWELTNT